MMAKNNTPNPTDGRMKDMEVNAISNYLKPNMPLPQYLPYARFLLDTDLSHTAKLLYTLLLDRATLSQKNHWVDAQGRIYVVYTPTKMNTERVATDGRVFPQKRRQRTERNRLSTNWRQALF